MAVERGMEEEILCRQQTNPPPFLVPPSLCTRHSHFKFQINKGLQERDSSAGEYGGLMDGVQALFTLI